MAVYTKPSSLIELEGSGVVTINDSGMTGRRIGRVDTNQLAQAIGYLLGAITKTNDGQIYDSAPNYPGFPSLRVSSITSSPMGRVSNSSWDSAVLPSTFQKLEIEYKTVDYENMGQGDKEKPQENEEFMIQEIDYSCDTVIVPVKVQSTNFSSQVSKREVKHHIRLPKIEYSVTLPKVKYPKFDILQRLNGKINISPVFGGDAGTVLFDGPKLGNTISSIGDPAWKCVYKFIYNPKGWNKTIHPETLEWVNMTAVDGGDKLPYETDDLTLLWRNLRA